MHQKHIHIVSFDIPYPANYGGVIDVYYKLKALHDLGILIHLHCFEYGRQSSEKLNQICKSVTYYPRKTNLLRGLSSMPYIVKSRLSRTLIQNLLQDNYPILFEGIHTCGTCLDKRFEKRFIVFRPANIEHEYYAYLAQADTSLFKKTFHYLEAKKLKHFEKKLKNINLILGISEADTQHFRTCLPQVQAEHIPAFHAGTTLECKTGKGEYALYHGNLGVSENNKVVVYLLEEVFSKLNYPIIICGKDPSKKIRMLCDKLEHAQLIENPNDDHLFRLIQNAHIHVLPTFQASGFKLKLIHTLFNGRHILTNKEMLSGTPFHSICHLAEDTISWISQIEKLSETTFSEEDIKNRKAMLFPNYSNSANAEKIKQLIFDSI